MSQSPINNSEPPERSPNSLESESDAPINRDKRSVEGSGNQVVQGSNNKVNQKITNYNFGAIKSHRQKFDAEIKELSKNEQKVLVLCSLCVFFDKNIVRKIINYKHIEAEFDSIWISLTKLSIIQELPKSNKNFFIIPNPYRKWLKIRYSEDNKKFNDTVGRIMSQCHNEFSNIEDISLYRLGMKVHLNCGDSFVINDELLSELFYALKFSHPETQNVIYNFIFEDKDLKIKKKYQFASFIVNQSKLLGILILPSAFILKQLAKKITPPNLSVKLLYISSLIYQTWCYNWRAIETLKLADRRSRDKEGKIYANLSSRLALSYIAVGRMNEAGISLNKSTQILDKFKYENEWIDNQLNQQIFYLKKGLWRNSFEIGDSLLSRKINDIYLQAKCYHIMGVTCLHLGYLKNAKKYAYECEKFSNNVSLKSWIVGRAWRNRFAYSLISNIDLVQGNYEGATEYADIVVNQIRFFLSPLFYPLSKYFIDYITAYILASKGEYFKARRIFRRIIKSQYVEKYYKVAAEMNLAETYIYNSDLYNGKNIYNSALENAKNYGFEYLRFRAYNRLNSLSESSVSIKKLKYVDNKNQIIGSDAMDKLIYIPPI